MQFKTTQDVIGYLTSLEVDKPVIIDVPVQDNRLFHDTVRDYQRRFKRQHGGEDFCAMTGTTTPCRYRIVRMSHDVLQERASERQSRAAEAKAIAEMGDRLSFPYSPKLLTWVRTHVYSHHIGKFKVNREDDLIVVTRKKNTDTFRGFYRAMLEAAPLPMKIECSEDKIGYVRNIVSEMYEGREVGVMALEDGCMVYDWGELLVKAEENRIAAVHKLDDVI